MYIKMQVSPCKCPLYFFTLWYTLVPFPKIQYFNTWHILFLKPFKVTASIQGLFLRTLVVFYAAV